MGLAGVMGSASGAYSLQTVAGLPVDAHPELNLGSKRVISMHLWFPRGANGVRRAVCGIHAVPRGSQRRSAIDRLVLRKTLSAASVNFR